MTHNDTRVSNERLAEMLAGLEGVTPGPWIKDVNPTTDFLYGTGQKGRMHIGSIPSKHDREYLTRCDPDTIRAMILELQALRSTPAEAEPVAWRYSSGWVTGPEMVKLWLHTADAGLAKSEAAAGNIVHPLYAHPLPNPSPSDGEVSDVLRRARNYIDDMPHLFPENAHPNDRDTHRQLEAEREPLLLALTAAIQSKRGQP